MDIANDFQLNTNGFFFFRTVSMAFPRVSSASFSPPGLQFPPHLFDISYRNRRRSRLFSRSVYRYRCDYSCSYYYYSPYTYVSDLCTIISTRIPRPCACIILFDRLSDATRAGSLERRRNGKTIAF